MPELSPENQSAEIPPAKLRELPSSVFFLQHPNHNFPFLEPSSFMDLDFADLEASWPLDHLFSSDQPFSPLWAFADAVNVSDYSRRSLSGNPEPVDENPREEEEEQEQEVDVKVKIPPPFLAISPLDNFAELSVIIKERMTQALRYFKESTEQNQILVQVWAPTKSGNHYVLTTSGQPFVLGPHSNGLNNYRTVSLMYMFAVDGEINGTLGLPARVFRQEVPEWTPNVQYYSSKEYSRVDHAKHYNVRGTLALPVFEPSRRSCVGVIELIMNSEKINYAPEVDKVCKALEAVNLKSSQILDHPNIQICNKGRQNALAEILEVLTEVCETYKLPLAQTWIPCRHRSVLAHGGGVKKSCSSFDGSCMGQICMSTTDVAFYVVDAHMWGFRDACAEHHLQKGQGVAGRAFSSFGLCFCRDISRFCKKEYPLVHYARMFGLTGSFSICLRSRHTGDDDYVLEFFLPCNVTDYTEQLNLLDSILATMKHDLQNLMVASGKTLEDERQRMEIIEVSMDENVDFQIESKFTTPMDSMNCVPQPIKDCQPQLMDTDAVNPGNGVVSNGETHKTSSLAENKQTKKTSERKRGKAEKQISLEVLQHYFAGSLKDAAKALGVCPTTMKRICRQHGISRWPSRKINKVNRSLTKLKCVIESVQGSDGAFSLTSLAPSSIPVGVGSYSWPVKHLDEVIEHPSPNPRINEENPDQNGFTSKIGINGSREVSSGTSTSHGSCHGSPGPESNPPNTLFISTSLKFQQNGEQNLQYGYHPQESFSGMPLNDAGSSKDLRKLCDERSWVNPPSSRLSMPPGLLARKESKTVTIKATFREDIIRFRLSLPSSIVELKEEVAKRLKLDVGTFEIKYLDDDHEWVMVACDTDLQECLEISKVSGSNMIRLLVHDLSGNLGSSCESSGEL